VLRVPATFSLSASPFFFVDVLPLPFPFFKAVNAKSNLFSSSSSALRLRSSSSLAFRSKSAFSRATLYSSMAYS
jgi:hypothetical protein